MTHQDLSQKTPPAESSPRGEMSRVSSSRRKLLIQSGAVVPVVITLASRPVLGCDCISPSATMSSAMSHKTEKVGTCAGVAPSIWRNTLTSWPTDKNAAFHGIFVVGSVAGSSFFKAPPNSALSMSMWEVLNAAPLNQLAHYFVAAYLNIVSGKVSPKALTLDKLQAIWHEWAMTGSYTPRAGATPWNDAGIKLYFKTYEIAPT